MGTGDSSHGKVVSSGSERLSSEPKRDASGEFTRMFQAPAPPRSDERGSAASEAREEENIFADILPDLTQDQRSAISQVVPVKETATASAHADPEGEFTRFFQAPVKVSPLPVQATPRRPEPQADDDTDEWLRLLEMEAEPPVDRSPVVPPAPAFPALENLPEAPSEFTLITAGQPKRAISENPPVADPLPLPTPQPAPLPLSGAPIATPLSYAPMPRPPIFPTAVQPVAVPALSVPSVQSSAAQAGERLVERPKVSYLPLLIVFNVLFVLAVLLILYFALHR